MGNPQEGYKPFVSEEDVRRMENAGKAVEKFRLTQVEYGIFPVAEALSTDDLPSLLEQAAASQHFDMQILQVGNEIRSNGHGDPISLSEDTAHVVFTPRIPEANPFHLRGAIDAGRGAELQKQSEQIAQTSSFQA